MINIKYNHAIETKKTKKLQEDSSSIFIKPYTSCFIRYCVYYYVVTHYLFNQCMKNDKNHYIAVQCSGPCIQCDCLGVQI